MAPRKAIELDGRTGEGGGQLVRIACALAAVTSQPIRITHVRGNRGGPRGGGGLKSQHVTSLQWLATATGATVTGLAVGSHTVEFRPSLAPPAAAAALALQQQQPPPPSRRPKQAVSGGDGNGGGDADRPLQIRLAAHSPAASAMLILQAVLPFLLFAGTVAEGGGDGESSSSGGVRPRPIDLEIRGGTNVGMSLSYEYLDQVLLPALASRFEIAPSSSSSSGRDKDGSGSGSGRSEGTSRPVAIERRLVERGWSVGAPIRAGCVRLQIRPLGPGEVLRVRRRRRRQQPKPRGGEDDDPAALLDRIDASILTPAHLHAPLQAALASALDGLFPGVDLRFVLTEESGHEARMYALLVAHGASPTSSATAASTTTTTSNEGEDDSPPRWGHDFLYNGNRRRKTPEQLCQEIARKVTWGLFQEVAVARGAVDQFLQDQLVVFQALAEGTSRISRSLGSNGEKLDQEDEEEDVEGLGEDLGSLQIKEERMRKDKTYDPFGMGSLHTTTARWVAAELLPQANWYNKGAICEGAGVSF